MLPQKILKSKGLEMLFPAFSESYLWFTHIANYLLRTLSHQTNAHWEYNNWDVNYKIENRLSLYLAFENSQCFTFQSHHSKFVDFIGRSFFANFQNSCLIIFYFQHFMQVCTYSLGKKKTVGARALPGPPLATALRCPSLSKWIIKWSTLASLAPPPMGRQSGHKC